MTRKILLLTAAIALLVGVAPGAASVSPTGSLTAAIAATERATDRTALNPADRPAPDLDEIVQVFIQLDLPSVAEYVATESAAGVAPGSAAQRAQRNRVLAQQARLRTELGPLVVDELSTLQIGANGFRALVRVRDLPSIRAIPGVLSVARVAIHQRTNATSVPWIGAPAVWDSAGPTGDGVSIAVIDTGIDYYHANFGGDGDPADYTGDDPTTIEMGTFPTLKVVGGFDFAGDDYDASGDVGPTTPSPDDDPLDCNGHGSHVAGTAAGFGVLAGATYAGTYDATTHTNDFDIGPGVAPEAVLYALKVFGCEGSTDVTSDAIEWALDPNDDGSIADAVDVINMSLGSDFGSPDDPSAIASANAAANGIIVVAASGNAGPVPYVTSSPAIADGAISVAASIDGGVTVLGLDVNSPLALAGTYEAAEADFSAPLSVTGDVTGDLVIAEPLDGCSALTNAAEIAGNIALIQRGTCPFVDKYTNAEDAGATGVVVFNNTSGPPIVMAGDVPGATIPAVMVSLADGTLFEDAITGGDTVNVTMSASTIIAKPELSDTMADFSSQGPGHFGSGFKPEVSAPGFSIESTDVGTGVEGGLSSGTSMATPHVAGVAALLRDQYPAISVAQLKSMIMNSARPALVEPGDIVDPSDDIPITLQGTGIVQADVASGLAGYTMPAGISFGHLNPLTDTSVSEQVRVFRLGSPGATYDIEITPIQSVAGVSVSAPATVVVPGSGSAVFDVTMMLEPAAMPADDAFFSQTESDGRITLTNQSDSTDVLNLAYFGVVDPASAVSGTGSLGGVTLSNTGPSDGVAEGFTLIAEGDDVGGVIGAVGVRTGDIGDSPVVEFGIGQTGPWNTLSARETDIFLDVDEDGVDDFVLVAADLGLLQGGDPIGAVVTALLNLDTSDFVLEWFALADNNDGVQVLTVDRFGDFGILEEGDTTFDYAVATFDLQTELLDGLQIGSVDLADVVDGTLSFLVEAGGTTEVTGIAGGFELGAVGGTSDTLWLYANNQGVSQYQVVAAETSGAPFWPAGAQLTASNVTQTQATLSWPDAEDSDGTIANYVVSRDGTEIVTLGGGEKQFTATGLVAGNTYLFSVVAVDDDDLESEPLERSVNAAATALVATSVGAVDPTTGQWYLRHGDGSETVFFYGNPGDYPMMGDWDGDGIDTPGLYRQSDGFVYLRNSNSQGIADIRFFFGNPGDVPIAGDFNDDGFDTVSIYRPSTGQVFIINELGANDGGLGAAELSYFFGNPGDKPFIGDFDGDGVDTVGLHRESTGFVYFRNSHTQGNADAQFFFGDPGDRLVAGDWGTIDGIDTPGLFRPSNTTWYFRHTNTQGNADSQFSWGSAQWLPVAGNFGIG